MASNSLSRLAAAACIAAVSIARDRAAADDDIVNPVLSQPEAIAADRMIYRTRCYICHLGNGGRGPDLFASELSDYQFLETGINGRGTMPAFGTLMTPDDVWSVHAYVKSTDHHE